MKPARVVLAFVVAVFALGSLVSFAYRTLAKVTGHAGFELAELRASVPARSTATTDRSEAPLPPPELFERVSYAAPLGRNAAYVTPVREGAKKPAIVWIAGGFDWGIGENAWLGAPRANDQSARAFRDAGLVLMLPALRGSNENPGNNECFLGEIEDVIAAARYLATRPDVDPARIYLGGHSTGGTIALLTAASTDDFRAVFAFGPVADVRQYGDASCLPSDATPDEELARAPIEFLDQIVTPTFVIEGQNGNAAVLPDLARARGDAPVQTILVPRVDHFEVLAPGSEVVARAILADTGRTPRLAITAADVVAALARDPEADAFWAWVSAHAASLRWPVVGDVLEGLGEALHAIDPGLGLEFTRRDDAIELAVSADGDVTLFDRVREIVARAPSLPGLRVVAFRQRGDVGSFSLRRADQKTLSSDDVWYRLGRDPEGELGLHLSVRGMSLDDAEAEQQGVLLLVQNAIGELDLARLASIEWAELPQDPRANGLSPLGELAGDFDRMSAER